MVEALLNTDIGADVRARMRGGRLHAPAHLDAEVLSALGRLHRAGDASGAAVVTALEQLIVAPVRRHPLASLLTGAWGRRANQRLADALYTELALSLGSALLITTDARLARSDERAELIGGER
jgi:predicted nucleic acid-binding protein